MTKDRSWILTEVQIRREEYSTDYEWEIEVQRETDPRVRGAARAPTATEMRIKGEGKTAMAAFHEIADTINVLCGSETPVSLPGEKDHE